MLGSVLCIKQVEDTVSANKQSRAQVGKQGKESSVNVRHPCEGKPHAYVGLCFRGPKPNCLSELPQKGF